MSVRFSSDPISSDPRMNYHCFRILKKNPNHINMWPPSQSSSGPSREPIPSPPETASSSKKKLRAACDRCHRAKTKCSGGTPCSSCSASNQQCTYSVTTRTGRPKGAKNKKTLAQMREREQAEAGASMAERAYDTASPAESSTSSYPPGSALFPPPGLYDQRPMDIDDMLRDVTSTEGGDDMSNSINWNELFSHNPGSLAPQMAPSVSTTSEGTETRPTESLLPLDPSRYSVGSRSGIGSSSTSGTDEITTVMRHTVLNTQLRHSRGEGDENPFNPRSLFPPPSPLLRTPSSASMQPRNQRPTSCRCLEQHVELFRNLKNLLQGQVVLDNVLTGIQQALIPWQNLIQCAAVSHDEDHAILVRSLMSMRVLLRHLHQICVGNGPPSGYATPDQTLPALGVFTSGGYNPTQNEQRHITDLLIFHALRKVKFILNGLKAKFAHSRGHTSTESLASSYHSGDNESTGGDADVDNIPPLFEDLERGIAAIFSAVQNRARGSGPSQE